MIVKRNGLTCPLHKLQVLTWVLAAVQTAGSYALIYPELSKTTGVSFLCLFSLSLGTALVLGILITVSDPTDPVVYAHQASIEKGLPFDERHYALVCTSCQTNVSALSKHCARCGRCIAKFDHHCKWLNNCIGESNYRKFVALLWAVEFTEGVILAFGLMSLLEILSEVDLPRVVGISVLLGIAVILFLILFQLILFHIWLGLHGLTTYDYIRSRRVSSVRTKPTPDLVLSPPVSSSFPSDFKPHAQMQRPAEYNLEAELRPVSDEESPYSLSESILSGSLPPSRQLSSRNELL